MIQLGIGEASKVKDPRTSRFYELRKRDRDQLTAAEARELETFCQKMTNYVADGKTRKVWSVLEEEYAALAETISEPGT